MRKTMIAVANKKIMKRLCWILFTFILVLGLDLAPLAANSADNGQYVELTGAEEDLDDRFGLSVDISGDVAIVGAPGNSEDGYSTPGTVYIFRYDGDDWVEEARLIPESSNKGDHFGHSVAVSGNVAVITALEMPDPGYYTGVAYVFRYDGQEWKEEARLTSWDGTPDDKFGCCVDIDEDIIVVGAERHVINDDEEDYQYRKKNGAVYIFHYDGNDWVGEARLVEVAEGDNAYFGGSVAVSGDKVIIGALQDSADINNGGAAFVFHRHDSNWEQQEKLTPIDYSMGRSTKSLIDKDEYARDVAISGDFAAVTYNYRYYGFAHAGELHYREKYYANIYIYRWDDDHWGKGRPLVPNIDEDMIGKVTSVSIDGNYLICGLRETLGKLRNYHAVGLFFYDGDEWVEEDRLYRGFELDSVYFGYSAAVSGHVVLVGTAQHYNGEQNSGTVRIYQLPGADFAGSVTQGHVPLEISFTDCSTVDTDSWLWDFGDGESSKEQSPTHIYTASGEYTVGLTVSSDDREYEVVKDNYLNVQEPIRPAELVIKELFIPAIDIHPGEEISIGVMAFNKGEEMWSDSLQLLINGYPKQSLPVDIAPGTTQTVSFIVQPVEPGEYNITIGSVDGTFTVIEPPAPPSHQAGDNSDVVVIMGIVALGFILIGGVALFLLVTRRSKS
jgi:PKD repeat protein